MRNLHVHYAVGLFILGNLVFILEKIHRGKSHLNGQQRIVVDEASAHKILYSYERLSRLSQNENPGSNGGKIPYRHCASPGNKVWRATNTGELKAAATNRKLQRNRG
jgi:hypothetical protein